MLAELLQKIFGHKSSKVLAKSRLHFVLVQDRTGLNNQEISNFKEEMLKVIEKYFVIDKSGFDIAYKRAGETTTLYINSPIIVRRQDSIGHDVGARKMRRKGDRQEKHERSEEAPPAEVQAEAEVAEAVNATK